MDPRIARTTDAVRHAVLAVLGDRGYAAFTVEAVADEAGVAKSTIYRHWPSRLALVADALETLNEQPDPHVDGGSARAQVRVLVAHLADSFGDSVLSACIPALVEAAEHEPEVAAFLHSYSAARRGRLVDTIQRGVDSGELAPDVDAELAALALVGPIVYRRTLTPRPLSLRRAAQLVDLVLGP